ncbi:hypothetical protein [Noviherbaspirillum malthae]|uniref:hypothetical protein n=1 Tax=Noviherbaspirillum malthae TaxID=1260987 RepID=UPI00188E7159|nr:hypothetical protein [Noviherbaspirillum malthae]
MHVADEERTIASNEVGVKFMQVILALIGHLASIALTRWVWNARWAVAGMPSMVRHNCLASAVMLQYRPQRASWFKLPGARNMALLPHGLALVKIGVLGL